MRNLAHHLTVLGVNATCAATVQADVTATYSKRWGGYHNLNHIKRVLSYFDKMASDIENVGYSAAIVAIWFHDYVYLGNADDVKESAKIAAMFLADNYVENGYVDIVREMVLATDYRKPSSFLNGGLTSQVRAADIAAACSGTYAQFKDNCERVAAENNMSHGSVSFRASRIKAVKPLLPIILTPQCTFARELHTQAVRNLERYTDDLIKVLTRD